MKICRFIAAGGSLVCLWPTVVVGGGLPPKSHDLVPGKGYSNNFAIDQNGVADPLQVLTTPAHKE